MYFSVISFQEFLSFPIWVFFRKCSMFHWSIPLKVSFIKDSIILKSEYYLKVSFIKISIILKSWYYLKVSFIKVSIIFKS